ncbi:heat shock 70 kDa protein 16-like [Juglans regia]|uniref:Heat shock 70 kDa protein 16-like n=1 Tax=Juglans regia TaxID=51240 RepID=A0A6P9EMB5_JUGRE|nr:heat shock 70 kDa protein 16-like [Juglans regia]
MSVVGFDIGNEDCVIAVVKQRGIDVLLNDESKRETPAVICFVEKQQFMGSAGAASALMNLKSTISQVKRLIGGKFSYVVVQNELKELPFETSKGLDGGILIHLTNRGESHTCTPEQIMAMLFAHLKEIIEKRLEMPISDCVIGIPSYFTDLQRCEYLNAPTIAGLKPLRLMHDCTAAALSFGIYKTDFPSSGPTYVAFVDIGHCDTQVSIALFEAGHRIPSPSRRRHAQRRPSRSRAEETLSIPSSSCAEETIAIPSSLRAEETLAIQSSSCAEEIVVVSRSGDPRHPVVVVCRGDRRGRAQRRPSPSRRHRVQRIFGGDACVEEEIWER